MVNQAPDWMAMLRREVERTTVTKTAAKIGYSRTSVSLVLNEKYDGGTDNIAAAVIKILSQKIDCPYLQQPLTPDECAAHHSADMPLSSPSKIRHWKACKTCSFNGCSTNDNTPFREVQFS